MFTLTADAQGSSIPYWYLITFSYAKRILQKTKRYIWPKQFWLLYSATWVHGFMGTCGIVSAHINSKHLYMLGNLIIRRFIVSRNNHQHHFQLKNDFANCLVYCLDNFCVLANVYMYVCVKMANSYFLVCSDTLLHSWTHKIIKLKPHHTYTQLFSYLVGNIYPQLWHVCIYVLSVYVCIYLSTHLIRSSVKQITYSSK